MDGSSFSPRVDVNQIFNKPPGLAPAIPVGSVLPQPPQPPPLSNDQKTRWNKFIQYVSDNKFNQNPDLDRRDKQVGVGLIQQFNKLNPQQAIDPALIPQVQSELQGYRSNLVNNYQRNPTIMPGVKTPDEIMPNLSIVDGWPGTKTLSHRFPIAMLEKTDADGNKKVINYGTDMAAETRATGFNAQNK